MAEPMFGGLFNRFWKRFGEDKQLNLAKAIAETIARRLSIPIANSTYISRLHKFANKLFGEHFSEISDDALTIIAKVLIHVPDRFIEYISAVTRLRLGDISIVLNQFVDQLIGGVIENFKEGDSPSEQAIVQSIKGFEAKPELEASIIEVTKYGFDTKTRLFHYLHCDELYEIVSVQVEQDGGKDGKGPKKGSKRVRQLKDRVRLITLEDAIEFTLDPFAIRPGCCGGVLVHSSNMRDELGAYKPQTMSVCLSKMGEDGVTLNARLQTVCDALWTELLTNAQHTFIATLDYEELRDYLLRPMWTSDIARQFFANWNPESRPTLFLKLNGALEILRRMAPPKARPEAKKPSWIDVWIEKGREAVVQYIKGENSPLLNAAQARVDKYSDGMREGNEELAESIEFGLDALAQGL